MATGFWDSLGTSLGSGLGQVVGSVSQGLSQGLGQLIATKVGGGGGGVTVLPGGAQVVPVGGGVGPVFSDTGGVRGMPSDLSGRRFLQGTPAQAVQERSMFDLPFIDITPQGTSMLTQPFRVTRTGTQVAKPFQAVRSNGSVEWFIPAGKPTAWSKASVKKRRTCRPR